MGTRDTSANGAQYCIRFGSDKDLPRTYAQVIISSGTENE